MGPLQAVTVGPVRVDTANRLYDRNRVLKLHGSFDWLKYTPARVLPHEYEESPPDPTPPGIVLERHPNFWMGESPTRNGWHMEPTVIPPQLYKQFRDHPFPTIWEQALEALQTCRELIVVGYSFPPTDFRTRRLFLEAFSEHSLQALTIINPDTSVAGLVRKLTGFNGPVVTCDDLQSFYGVTSSWFGP